MTRALVTGTSSGIGRAIAIHLAEHGYEVIATARNPHDIDDLPVARALQLDVTSDESVAAVVAEVPDVDVLVNNAGIDETGPIDRYPMGPLHRMFETNVFGPMRLITAYAPGMRERGEGAIVNMSSVQGKVATPLAGTYSACKHALEALSESLHYEIGTFGVRVAIIEPGYIAPGMQKRLRHGEDSAPYDRLRRELEGLDSKVLGGKPRPGPELVAETVRRAIETDQPKLRWPVGDDAEMVLSVRKELDDVAFEATMRAYLDLTW